MSYEHILERKSVVVNDGWKPEAFIRGIEKHLGEMHHISDADWSRSGETCELVGFGGESMWRGKVYREGERIIALELISNSDKKLAEITMATMGLSIFTHNKFAYFSDVIAGGIK